MDISAALSLFGSRIKVMEVLLVKQGIKPVARLLCNEIKLASTLSLLGQEGLFAALSGFKVIKDPSQGIYADRSLKVSKDDPRQGYVFLYVSKDNDKAMKAKEWEEKGDHRELGQALGYPQCCGDFFGVHFDKNHTDLTLDALQNSDGFEFPFQMNIAARHFDAVLLSHFPCSFRCKDSLDIAKKNLEVLERHALSIAIEMVPLLKSPVLYTPQGVFLLEDGEKKGNELFFRSILATQMSKLFYFLQEEKRLRIMDKDRIAIGDEVVEGENKGIMVFS